MIWRISWLLTIYFKWSIMELCSTISVSIPLVYDLQHFWKFFLNLFSVKWVCIIRVYNFRCMETLPFDFSDKDLERNITYAYFINKIIDLLDTIFFILRKKYKQVTFLHVYHHIMMVYTVYWVIRLYGCGAQYCILALLNSFVHVVMYFYYLISALNTDMRGSLWWKKYITLIQIIQFTILWLQASYMLVFRRDCPFPQYLQWMQLIQATLMITMFSKFYIKTYFKSGKSRVQKKRL